MTDETPYGPIQRYGLIESVQHHEVLKLPVEAIREVGPAAQTLAGLFRLTNRETFASVNKIAEHSRLPVATARKQLDTLVVWDWISNIGRQPKKVVRCPGGAEVRARRTCTIRLMKKAIDARESNWTPLPWWACNHGLSWAEKTVFAAVMRRLLGLIAAVQREGDHDDPDEIFGAIENLGGDEKFRFPLDKLAEESGGSRRSVIRAKRGLAARGLINWFSGENYGDADMLVPNWEFRVAVTPTSPTRCRTTFEPNR